MDATSTYYMPQKSQSFSFLEHMCRLDIDDNVDHPIMTSMMATVGPACDSIEQLKDMMRIGVHMYRFNVSYRNYDYFVKAIKNTRAAEAALNLPAPISIGIDITGPGIRVGHILNEKGEHYEFQLKKGEIVTFSSEEKYMHCSKKNIMYANISHIVRKVTKGQKVLIEDGPLTFAILESGGDYVICEVIEEGMIGSSMLWTVRGVLPGPAHMTTKDRMDIQFAAKSQADVIFASYVWDPNLILEIKEEIKKLGSNMQVVAKIENYEGVKRFSEIAKVADGIFIARGNLGIDLSPEKVFLIQKSLIAKSNLAGKPVICATQMLASMIYNPRPTRAEITDVANAILDGADCVMLSRETARGKYPVKVASILRDICVEAESVVFSIQLMRDLKMMVTPSESMDRAHITALAAVEAAHKCSAKAIFVVTATGRSATLLAKYRPRSIILALTKSAAAAKMLRIYRAVFPILTDPPDSECPWLDSIDHRINFGMKKAQELKYLNVGDTVVIVTGWAAGTGSTNTIRVFVVPESYQPFVKPEGTEGFEAWE